MTRRTVTLGRQLARKAEAAEKRRERLARRQAKRERRLAAPTRAKLGATVAARVDGVAP